MNSTPPNAPPSKSESEAKNPPKMPDIELSHATNVNEVADDVLEITGEFLLNISEKTLRDWAAEDQRTYERKSRSKCPCCQYLAYKTPSDSIQRG